MKKSNTSKKLSKTLTRLAKASGSGSVKALAEANQELHEENIKIQKGLHRARLMKLGLYGLHKEKKVASKKTYKRKGKHPGQVE